MLRILLLAPCVALALPVDATIVEEGMAAADTAQALPPEAVLLAARLSRGDALASVPPPEASPAQGMAG